PSVALSSAGLCSAPRGLRPRSAPQGRASSLVLSRTRFAHYVRSGYASLVCVQLV
ncbi:hypothetical protein AAGT75_005408, partial [Escherichia coli]